MMKVQYQILRSSSGLRIALASLPDSECAAVSVHLPVGSRDDPPGLSGLAHFVEHMCFKGTERRDARAISLETEDAGASLNASTSEDQTVYEARGDAGTLPLLVDVLGDMLWHSTWPAGEIGLERDVIAEEIVMYEENPSDHIGDLISRGLWAPHPLGDPIAGTRDSIAAIGRDELVDFAARHHAREDLVIAIAGPFGADEVLALLEPQLPRPTAAPPAHPYRDTGGTRSPLSEPRETQQVQMALAWATFGRKDPRRHALRLLAMVLGEGASSRLFQVLREDRGLCYHVSCDATFFDDTGALEIHAGLEPASRDEALACIRHEIADLATRGPSPAELERARRLVASQTRAAMEGTGAHAGWAGECLLQYGKLITPAQALAQLAGVGPEDVRNLAAELCRPQNFAMAEIRPTD